MKIAIHGAESTVKEALAAGLARALAMQDRRTISIEVSPPVSSCNVDLNLVCGLDWTGGNTKSALSVKAIHEFEDNLLRDELTRAGVIFQVIYGHGAVQINNALKAVSAAGLSASTANSHDAIPSQNVAGKPTWQWECDKCGDASCERRLFSNLIG